MARYISASDTAKLIRKSLKEAFAGVKFSVVTSSYSGGASIGVRWTDGPNAAQVEAITNRFRGAYFDSGIDYKGSVHHMMAGEPVRFACDFVHTTRSYSDQAVTRAIDRFARHFAGNLREAGIAKPTVGQYRSGDLRAVQLPGLHLDFGFSVDTEIRQILAKNSDRMKTGKSTTAGGVFVTHDDGYGRSSGSGGGAVLLMTTEGQE